jgi:hypothetical protein
VVNDPKSVSECLSIYERIQGISRRVEDAQARSIGASVLFFSKVLIELSSSELLISLGLLVLSCLEFAFKICDISLEKSNQR